MSAAWKGGFELCCFSYDDIKDEWVMWVNSFDSRRGGDSAKVSDPFPPLLLPSTISSPFLGPVAIGSVAVW